MWEIWAGYASFSFLLPSSSFWFSGKCYPPKQPICLVQEWVSNETKQQLASYTTLTTHTQTIEMEILPMREPACTFFAFSFVLVLLPFRWALGGER